MVIGGSQETGLGTGEDEEAELRGPDWVRGQGRWGNSWGAVGGKG